MESGLKSEAGCSCLAKTGVRYSSQSWSSGALLQDTVVSCCSVWDMGCICCPLSASGPDGHIPSAVAGRQEKGPRPTPD